MAGTAIAAITSMVMVIVFVILGNCTAERQMVEARERLLPIIPCLWLVDAWPRSSLGVGGLV